MSTISLRVTGPTEIQTGFNKYAQTIEPVCRADTYAAIERATKKSPGWLGGTSYTTPELPSYQRTGVLGRSVALEQDGLSSRVKVEAYNEKGQEYGVYVIGDAYGQGQAAVHQGRWPLLRQAVDEEILTLTTPGQGLDAELQKAAKDCGL